LNRRTRFFDQKKYAPHLDL